MSRSICNNSSHHQKICNTFRLKRNILITCSSFSITSSSSSNHFWREKAIKGHLLLMQREEAIKGHLLLRQREKAIKGHLLLRQRQKHLKLKNGLLLARRGTQGIRCKIHLQTSIPVAKNTHSKSLQKILHKQLRTLISRRVNSSLKKCSSSYSSSSYTSSYTSNSYSSSSNSSRSSRSPKQNLLASANRRRLLRSSHKPTKYSNLTQQFYLLALQCSKCCRCSKCYRCNRQSNYRQWKLKNSSAWKRLRIRYSNNRRRQKQLLQVNLLLIRQNSSNCRNNEFRLLPQSSFIFAYLFLRFQTLFLYDENII